jgi:hypothetical protein
MNRWIEKQRHLIDFTASSLARRKGKSLGLLVVYTLLVFVLASVSLYTHALRNEATRVLAGTPEVVLQRLIAGRHDLIPPGYIEKIGRVRGVQKIEGRLWGYYYDSVLKANYTFMVPSDRRIAEGEIVVGPALERSRGLAEGNGISFRAYSGELHTFIVSEVLAHESELVNADLVLMSEADFRRFFAYPDGHYTDIALWVANPQEVRNVGLKLINALPDSRPILREEVLRTYASIFDWREGMMLALLSAAILAFGIFAWEKAAGLSARKARDRHPQGDRLGDRRRDRDEVLGRLPGLAARLPVGYVAAYVHVFHFDFTLFAPVLKGWAVLTRASRSRRRSTACRWRRCSCSPCCPTPRPRWCRSGAQPPPTPTP